MAESDEWPSESWPASSEKKAVGSAEGLFCRERACLHIHHIHHRSHPIQTEHIPGRPHSRTGRNLHPTHSLARPKAKCVHQRTPMYPQASSEEGEIVEVWKQAGATLSLHSVQEELW